MIKAVEDIKEKLRDWRNWDILEWLMLLVAVVGLGYIVFLIVAFVILGGKIYPVS